MTQRLATIACVLLVRLAALLVRFAGAFKNPWASPEAFNERMRTLRRAERITNPWHWAELNGRFGEIRDMIDWIASQPVLPWESAPDPVEEAEADDRSC